MARLTAQRRSLSRTSACLALALCALAALPACDTGDGTVTEATFDGVPFLATGQARLRVRNGRLYVTNLGASGADGIRIPRAFLTRADLSVEPVALPSGSRFGMQVMGTVGGASVPIGTAWSEDIGGGRHDIQFDFAAELGVTELVYEYLLDGVVVLTSPIIPTGGGTARVSSAGSTNVGPESVHAVREGGVVVVGTDYRGDAFTGGPVGGLDPGGCSAAFITVPFREAPVCADFVRARPVSATGPPFPAPSAFEVTGRRITAFVITRGRSE